MAPLTPPLEIDVFNGDADGLFAAHQLRLAEPGPDPARVRIVTGLKRDIGLLDRIDVAAADAGRLRLRVFDISLARNREALLRLLEAGAEVRWFDHHHAGDVPAHPRLRLAIDTSPATCTSVLVDREVQGRFRRWAVAAAYGDNLPEVARRLGGAAAQEYELALLRELGEAVNYNGYGETAADPLIAPEALYRRLAAYSDPIDFMRADRIVTELAAQRRTDLAQALRQPTWRDCPAGKIYRLPDDGWSRRVLGSFANLLAERSAGEAVAVLRATASGEFTASVRAPIGAPLGADRFCRRFGGDGRAGAAGIDRLPAAILEAFAETFEQHDWGR
jgi:hypothetical protein